jgi:(2Fe-2S) ferredoxin
MGLRFFLCQGKACRKRKKKSKNLREDLSAIAAIEAVECQNICKGPVVVFPVKGRLAWFKRVDSKKSRAALAKLATRGKMTKVLRKRLVRKREEHSG